MRAMCLLTTGVLRLKIAEVIPTVMDEFKPMLTVNITWPKATALVGNTVKVKKVQHTPHVQLFGTLPNFYLTTKDDNEIPQLTLALTDPDARSRDNPDWSQMCHWIITNVPLATASDEAANEGWKEVEQIVEYQPPSPPKKSGKHRYGKHNDFNT